MTAGTPSLGTSLSVPQKNPPRAVVGIISPGSCGAAKRAGWRTSRPGSQARNSPPKPPRPPLGRLTQAMRERPRPGGGPGDEGPAVGPADPGVEVGPLADVAGGRKACRPGSGRGEGLVHALRRRLEDAVQPDGVDGV